MGRSRGGLTTKIHALVDTDGLLIALTLGEDHGHERRGAAWRLGALGTGQVELADGAYDSNAVRRGITGQGAWANIKPLVRASTRPP